MKREWLIISAGAGIILLLGILAAGMEELSLCPGRPLPTIEEREMGAPGGAAALFDVSSLVYWFIRITILTFIVSAIVGFIFFREERRKILIALAVMVLISIVFTVLHYTYVPEEEEPIEEEIPIGQDVPMPVFPGVEVPPPQEAAEVIPLPGEVPVWAIYSTAGVLGILLAYLILRRRRGKTTQHLSGKEVSEAASRAAEELRQGMPVADVVMRCWVRMVEILSCQTAVRDSPSLTPREFTGLLRGRGFSDGAIERLTYLFEEIRYGARAAEPRREQALSALSSIEHAYGKT